MRSLVPIWILLFATACLAGAPNSQSKAVTGKEASYECGDRTLRVRTIQEYEDTKVEVGLFDRSGKPLFPTIVWPGTFVSLCAAERFLLLDTSTHFQPGASFLFASDLKVLSKMEFGEVAFFGKSEDDKLFWIQSRGAVGRSPITLLRVYSYRGSLELEKRYSNPETDTVNFENRRYEIKVVRPDFPG